MTSVLTNHNGLAVVETTVPPVEFNRELKKLDPRLFLELHALQDGRSCWTVQIQVAGDRPPSTVCYWSDENFDPLPLTWRLLDRVKQLDGGFAGLAERMKDSEEAAREKARRELRETGDETMKEMWPSITGKRMAALHRSQSLRKARDKQRAKGRKV